MKILIDVPEETYKFIMEHYGGYPGGVWDSWDAIKVGTPITDALPDGRVEWEDIVNAPTADVVEVVRCKDCKYYTPPNRASYGKGNYKVKYCTRTALLKVGENDYCSFGERSEE